MDVLIRRQLRRIVGLQTQIANDIDVATDYGRIQRMFSCKLIMDEICKLGMTTSSFETGRPNKGDTKYNIY